VVAPEGTVTTILVSLQEETVVAATPLNVMVLAPCGKPKFFPSMITVLPTEPELGFKFLMRGPSTKRANTFCNIAVRGIGNRGKGTVNERRLSQMRA
jgi:hypothetical protein